MAKAVSRTKRQHRILGLAIAALVLILDQLIKWVVSNPFELQQRMKIELLPIFDLTWVQNHGVSMGFLTADGEIGRWLLVALTAVIATGVLIWLWRETTRGDVVALGLVLGGALGNILDRVRYGYVLDFADLHFGEIRPFLVFNVGDAAITIGVLVLLVRVLFTRDVKPGKEV